MASLFKIIQTDTFEQELSHLKTDKGLKKRYASIKKTIQLLRNPRHPGLQTHPFTSLQGPDGEKVFEAYAEQNTPAAYRVFWYYGPDRKEITVFLFTPHP